MQKLSIRIASGIAFLAALASCSGPTPYAPAASRFGFSDMAVEANRVRVTFAGNSQTKRETVETYLLYRAAEVTLAAGGDWFRLAREDTTTNTSFRTVSTVFARGFSPSVVHHGGIGIGFGGISTARPVNEFTAAADVILYRGARPVDDPDAFDARSVLMTLEPEIARPAG